MTDPHPQLHRYWFTFAEPSHDPDFLFRQRVSRGVGVTAWTYDDALMLVRTTVFAGDEIPPIRHCAEDVDVSTLDQTHVIPNMHSPVWRGIWFPMGCEEKRSSLHPEKGGVV